MRLMPWSLAFVVTAMAVGLTGCGAFRPLDRRFNPASERSTARMVTDTYFLGVPFDVGYEPAFVAVSRTGNIIAVSGLDAPYIDVWDASTGARRARLVGHALPPIGGLAFSDDGRVLVSGGGEAGTGTIEPSIRFWALDTGTMRDVIPLAQTSPILGIALSRDSQRVLAASNDSLRMWSIEGGQTPLGMWVDHTSTICGMAASADFGLVATGGRDLRILLRTASTMDRFEPLLGHEAAPCGLAFSPDGMTLVSWDLGSNRSTLRLWDTQRVAPLSHLEIKGRVLQVLFAETGPVALIRGAVIRVRDDASSTSIPNGVSLVSAVDGQVLGTLPVTPKLVGASTDGRTVVTLSWTGRVNVFRRGGAR
jgi:WD40 repeat protein